MDGQLLPGKAYGALEVHSPVSNSVLPLQKSQDPHLCQVGIHHTIQVSTKTPHFQQHPPKTTTNQATNPTATMPAIKQEKRSNVGEHHQTRLIHLVHSCKSKAQCEAREKRAIEQDNGAGEAHPTCRIHLVHNCRLCEGPLPPAFLLPGPNGRPRIIITRVQERLRRHRAKERAERIARRRAIKQEKQVSRTSTSQSHCRPKTDHGTEQLVCSPTAWHPEHLAEMRAPAGQAGGVDGPH